MDGVELKTCLKTLHPDKPVLVLNCKEHVDSRVVPNAELARRLGLFELTNPTAVSSLARSDYFTIDFFVEKKVRHFVRSDLIL